jgi:hypothetical protein
MNTKRKRLGKGAALLQLVGLLAIAFLINALFGPKPLWAVVSNGRSLVWQVSVGIFLATAFSVPVLLAILKIDFFRSFKTLLLELTQRADLSGSNPLWFGLCAMRRHWRRAFVSRSPAAALGILVDWLVLRPCPLWNWWVQIHEFYEVGLRGVFISYVVDARACTDSSRSDRSDGSPFPG